MVDAGTHLLDSAVCVVKHCFTMTDDLNAMSVFVVLAETRGFRAAGDRLGISASAVSQTLRKLEAQLGVVLLQRTTRSVRLTEAGERLYAGVRPALEEVKGAIAAVGELSGEPRGTLRLLVGTAADAVLSGPLLADFLLAHPHITLDLVVSDAAMDIVAEGYDAGIQIGEVIDRDMVALPVSGVIRLTVVGSPAYFAQHSKPQHPCDLVHHACINWHAAPGAPPYRWEFTEPLRAGIKSTAQEIVVAVRSRALSTDARVSIELARRGVGLTIVYEDQVRDDVARGELMPVLEDYCEPFPGYYLYYPQRRHATPALRAFIDHVKRVRGNTTRARSDRRRNEKGRGMSR